jgi:hypothetical protein
LFILGIALLGLLAQEQPIATADNGAKMPLMVSFKDLKWSELPERKGMQFAVLSGDPKWGSIRRCARSPLALTTAYTPIAAKSRM